MSNNGSQHLSALTKDEITAPHVNLVPSDLPGDLYKYVADHVWEFIEDSLAIMPLEEFDELTEVIDFISDIKKRIADTPVGSERRDELISAFQEYKRTKSEEIAKAAVVFWGRIKDSKHKRKIVKRNVMTISYGSTAYGMSQQQNDDARKHGITSLNMLEQKWGSFMGRLVFEDCKICLRRPMRLLSIFEEAGKRAEAAGGFLSWTVPVTDFPVVQMYVDGTPKKVYIQYGPPIGERNSAGYYDNTLQINICFIENLKPAKGKQSQGASPNAIHSLDAAHLMMTVTSVDFPVTTIHDSFGCLLADMPDLYVAVREQFVKLYEHDPLTSLMNDIGGDASGVEIGTLDVNLVLDSEYCFA